jgi:hypothetical protein
MKTDDLINQLSSDLRPVRPVISAGRLALRFSILSIIMVALGLLIFHARPDVLIKISNPSYLTDLLIPLALMAYAYLLVGRLSIPGRTNIAVLLKFACVLFVSFVIFELARTIQSAGTDAIAGLDSAGIKCFLLVMLFATLPTGFLAVVTARRAPMRPLLVGIVIAVGGNSAGEVAIALHCPIDNVVHIALWHFVLPVVAGAALGTFVISKFLRW